jgi:kynureninase
MTDQPATVSAAEMAEVLLANFPPLPSDTSAAEQITWHELRARLLADIAAVIGARDAQLAAPNAWRQRNQLARHLCSGTECWQ